MRCDKCKTHVDVNEVIGYQGYIYLCSTCLIFISQQEQHKNNLRTAINLTNK